MLFSSHIYLYHYYFIIFIYIFKNLSFQIKSTRLQYRMHFLINIALEKKKVKFCWMKYGQFFSYLPSPRLNGFI